MYDFPSHEQGAALWQMYRTQFGIEDEDLPLSINWVGREIESCCELAYLLKMPLNEAAGYIVPVATSAADQIEANRRHSSGRFLSASYPGVFKIDAPLAAPFGAGAGRKMEIARSARFG
jgi:hypothetical protein